MVGSCRLELILGSFIALKVDLVFVPAGTSYYCFLISADRSFTAGKYKVGQRLRSAGPKVQPSANWLGNIFFFARGERDSTKRARGGGGTGRRRGSFD